MIRMRTATIMSIMTATADMITAVNIIAQDTIELRYL